MSVAGAVAFVESLRRRGLDVPVDAAIAFARALSHVDVSEGDNVYWSGRATLVRAHEDIADYDAAFASHFGSASGDAPGEPAPLPVTMTTDDGTRGDNSDVRGATPHLSVRYSPTEVLRRADLATLSTDERAEAFALIDKLRFSPRRRPSLRHRRGAGARSRPDISATVRAALRTDGEALRLLTHRPGDRPRRVVLLIDVSGSMQPYARALLRFAAAAVTARRGRVEVFAMGTRLTRLTRALDDHDPDRALAAAGVLTEDFGGGTRLGPSVREFNDRWGVRGTARGAVVVVLSDGWERDDPTLLGREMARLSRVAHEVVWVNPLRASPGYQPLAAGMVAALEHVDSFVDGHSVSALSDLADLLAAPGRAGVGVRS